MRTCLYAIALLLPAASAPAQPVFYDDFDGNDLLPHWSVPPPDHWEYGVTGGMLNVTGLFWPSDPHFGGNDALIGAAYEPQSDFRADVWMGWEAGDEPHELIFHVVSPQGYGIASFGYSTLVDQEPAIFAAASNQGAFEPAPPPGMYHFTITRVGAQYDFYLDGRHFASLADLSGRPAAIVNLWFLGPYPGQLGAFHIDRVRVVPGPGGLVALTGFGLWRAKRRR